MDLNTHRYIFSVLLLLLGCNCDETTTEQPLCPEPYVQNAYIHQPNHTYIENEKVELKCNDGYRQHYTKSQYIHLRCSLSGEWVNVLDDGLPIPTCERNLSCPLPDIEGGYIAGREGGYVGGEQAPIECTSGYTLQPFDKILLCRHDGRWTTTDGSEILPRCRPATCEKPRMIKHGSSNLLDSVLSEDGLIQDGTKVYYYCDDGYQLGSESMAVSICQSGEWLGQPAKCVPSTDAHLCESRTPVVLHAYYRLLKDGGLIYNCDEGYQKMPPGSGTMRCQNGRWEGRLPTCVRLGCPSPPQIEHGDFKYYGPEGGLFSVVNEGAQVYYFCKNGYRMRNKEQALMTCSAGKWNGALPVCEKRQHCDTPMDIPNGNWVFTYYPYPDFRIGSRLKYECNEKYKAIGPTEITCLPSGYWSEYAPRCLPQGEYCSEPGPVQHGFYMCKPNTCALFEVGTEVHYICNQHHEPRPDDVMIQRCAPGGVWTGTKPLCRPVPVVDSLPSPQLGSSSPLTVVMATSCSVLGLLLVVMVIVLLQRRVKPGHPPPAQLPPPFPPSAEGEVVRAVTDEHDRVALIQFADGVQVVLPTYEEAVGRSRPPPRLARFNSDSSHGSQRSQREYRPLPSLPPGMPSSRPDHHRNSVITTASTARGDTLSLAFGSMDTVNVSDATSQSITIGTYDSGASNPSLATASQRAAAGSLASSSLASLHHSEDAPLLERNTSPPPMTPVDPSPAGVSTPIDEEPDKE